MDISIYDNYSGVARDFDFFSIDGEYKTCDSTLTILCLRGHATVRLRIHDFELKRCHAIIIGPNIPFSVIESSPDFHIDVIRVGDSVFDVETYDTAIKNHLNRIIIDRPMNRLTERQTRMFHIIHSYLKVMMNEKEDYYRDVVIYQYIKIFLYEAGHILDDTTSYANLNKKERSITNRFFHLLENNFIENRKVEFYADQIGVTSKHLALVIKRTTGKHPSEWLENYALMESKKRLKSTDQTIQEISYDLNFSTPSHFSKFFKAMTGITPKEFRKSSK